MSSDSKLSDFSESSNDDEKIDVVYSQYTRRIVVFYYYLIIFIDIKYCRAQIQIQLQNRQICVHLWLEY